MTLTQERRTNDRHTAWFPIRMDADESGGEVAIAKNVSDKGMLLASYKKLVVGEPVKLALHVRPEGDIPRLVSGTIVRMVPNDEDPEGMWRYKIAVEFDAPDPELVPSILDND